MKGSGYGPCCVYSRCPLAVPIARLYLPVLFKSGHPVSSVEELGSKFSSHSFLSRALLENSIKKGAQENPCAPSAVYGSVNMAALIKLEAETDAEPSVL